jgi:hypothetical protein
MMFSRSDLMRGSKYGVACFQRSPIDEQNTEAVLMVFMSAAHGPGDFQKACSLTRVETTKA